jgi:hypothetical protein
MASLAGPARATTEGSNPAIGSSKVAERAHNRTNVKRYRHLHSVLERLTGRQGPNLSAHHRDGHATDAANICKHKASPAAGPARQFAFLNRTAPELQMRGGDVPHYAEG